MEDRREAAAAAGAVAAAAAAASVAATAGVASPSELLAATRELPRKIDDKQLQR